MKVFLILPAYNESSKSIDEILEKTRKYLPLKNTVVVDDGSKRSINLKNKVVVLRHQINLGKGAALKTGIRFAFKKGAGAIIMMDADGQHDPKEIKKFLKFLEQGYDIVFGSRRPSLDAPLIRLLGNKFASIYINILFGVYISDILSGYRGFNKKAYKLIRWQSSNYGVETEMVAKLGKNRGKINFTEFPIETIYLDNYKGVTILDAISILLHSIWWKLF